MTVIAARLADPWFAQPREIPRSDGPLLSCTGGEAPPPPEQTEDQDLDIWGLTDPGRPPATIAILSIVAVAVIGLATWLQQ